jgi:hypothetical protein
VAYNEVLLSLHHARLKDLNVNADVSLAEPSQRRDASAAMSLQPASSSGETTTSCRLAASATAYVSRTRRRREFWRKTQALRRTFDRGKKEE